jgi:hypothetical protein
MSPKTNGRRRLFGLKRKTVVIEGQKFRMIYSMSKVLVHEPPRRKSANAVTNALGDTVARIHGPYQSHFDYSPYMPKFRNGRWYPGKWLPLIEKSDQQMCISGYHACTMNFVPRWERGSVYEPSRVWLVEGVGPITTTPKSQMPKTTKIQYRTIHAHWVPGRYNYEKHQWIESHRVPEKKVRDRKAEQVVKDARENGGFLYEAPADKYNFQSIRIVRPITEAPKRKKKAPVKAERDWRMIKGVWREVYAKSGRRVSKGK